MGLSHRKLTDNIKTVDVDPMIVLRVSGIVFGPQYGKQWFIFGFDRKPMVSTDVYYRDILT